MTVAESLKDRNLYSNLRRAADLSNPFWDRAVSEGLADITADRVAGFEHRTIQGYEFENFSTYSYLGLDTDDRIRSGAIAALERERTLNSSISRMRVHSSLLDDTEAALSELLDAHVLTLGSAANAAWSLLPLVASGLLTGGEPPLMVFDKNAHFCLNAMKASVADETTIVTIRHDDVDELESLCRTNSQVAYVADTVYSTGGKAPLNELFALQAKYGLILVLDEAHSTSVIGHNGRGAVLDLIGSLNDRTFLLTSLNKGFGASGGAIALGRNRDSRNRDLALRYGGPLTWSQRVNVAGLGAIAASVELHRSGEVDKRQRQLRTVVELFDSLVDTPASGDGLPIRFVTLHEEEQTITAAQKLLASGFYTSAVFFPVIGRGKAGLRLMLRADLPHATIERFADVLRRVTE
ncbi:aminotransferase class I/II-fold pyridoxal phosphate-dependent enzyme [Rhodococcus erythropolis]|uniref:aminotransferase class I/II-fold pyridoxal phosphate-dependent enzyme n=1 Tax=Rhodococcus erythropolis TaxID=1833 RepID=UPI00061B5D23|nr:aminotransferase class I/II-fold pyridoxal phosphate-dependent enzyme [Rhodococcus erythropolis]AKD96364.1 aminotransferase class I and II [Rhodococcus erythropolis]MBO8146020.1 aminotransferase class I/II-fold pyridoxal phosphate-dependent enzyme [Rhodococcus erythropolis]MDO1490491.1 aminotransferase class I/II-fold pyridoxal phosphate-dependent enzyme [Rhodococcus erythropolis]